MDDHTDRLSEWVHEWDDWAPATYINRLREIQDDTQEVLSFLRLLCNRQPAWSQLSGIEVVVYSFPTERQTHWRYEIHEADGEELFQLDLATADHLQMCVLLGWLRLGFNGAGHTSRQEIVALACLQRLGRGELSTEEIIREAASFFDMDEEDPAT